MIIANTGIGIVQELRAKRNLDDLAVIGEVVESDSPEVDESLLTGEAEPVLKRPGDQLMSGSFVDQRGDAHFALKLAGAVLPWTAVGVAAVAGVLLEVVRRRAARRLSPSS